MPTDTLHAAKPSLAYAKLVATPTDLSWSQIYNAGNLFAGLSLSIEQPEEGISLPVIGKEIINILESEFFTLEEKNLHTIKAAITDSIKGVPDSVSLSLCLTCFKDNILYVFIVGEGRIVMKREEKIGVLLTGKPGKHILTASGYLQNKDIIILETEQFAKNISDTTLTSSLELALPNDIAEALSPQLHETDDGGQAAIIIVYHGIAKPQLEETDEEDETIEEAQQHSLYATEEDSEEQSFHKPTLKMPSLPTLPTTLSNIHLPHLNNVHNLPHRKKLFLSITIIILGLLAVSIFLTKQQQETKQTQELFHSVYEPAQKNYEEGAELKSLNPTLSREELTEAEQIINNGIGKFKKGSKEEQQLTELLAKIQTELGGDTADEANLIETKEASVNAKSYLSIEKATPGISFAQDAQNVYAISKTAIMSITKTSGNEKELIKNDDTWKNPVALAPYQGNMYVLDTENGVLKFVGESDTAATYFQGTPPDLNKAVSMAIDGSIWILLRDGSVLKYTRGQSDNLKLQGLEKPLATPIKIFTDLDATSVYVLDKGNRRVVVFDKKGTYIKEYAATIIRDAKDFEVLEKDKKILILSGNKIWEIPL